jgi:ribonuclease R
MADDYYRFVERAHFLRGEKNGRVYRLGDRVRVQVVRVDLERRQIDLGLADILEAVRKLEGTRSGRRRETRPPKDARPERSERSTRRRTKRRPGRRERALERATKKRGR